MRTLGEVRRLRPRIEAVVGLLVAGIAVFLGAARPSLLTLIAVPLIPTPFICLWSLVDPAAFERRRYARAYLLAATCLGGASNLFEVWLLSTHADIHSDRDQLFNPQPHHVPAHGERGPQPAVGNAEKTIKRF